MSLSIAWYIKQKKQKNSIYVRTHAYRTHPHRTGTRTRYVCAYIPAAFNFLLSKSQDRPRERTKARRLSIPREPARLRTVSSFLIERRSAASRTEDWMRHGGIDGSLEDPPFSRPAVRRARRPCTYDVFRFHELLYSSRCYLANNSILYMFKRSLLCLLYISNRYL